MADGSPVSEQDTVRRLRAAGCVFAEDEARLLHEAAATTVRLDELVTARVAGEPLEHLLGWVEFGGRRMVIEAGVFVPRRRTEFLVEQAVGLAGAGDVVVDLCCGSGALGAALAARVEGIELHAADLDPAAVGCARRTIAAVGGVAYVGDLFEPLPPGLRGRVRVLMANVPYVPTSAIPLMPSEARDHEPRVALDGGSDGLQVMRRMVSDARSWLAPGGSVLVEVSERQAPLVVALFADHRLVSRVARSQDYGATVVVGTRPVSL